MKVVGKIYEEEDYSKFHILEGNRDINHSRKIYESIMEHGFFNVPILINENFEIIDGQGRFEALRQLGYPIRFVVEEGAGLDACRILNIQQTNWKPIDYIKSYASSGNEHYIRLEKLCKDNGDFLSPPEIVRICKSHFGGGSGISKLISSGLFTLNEEEYMSSTLKFDYLRQFKGYVKTSKASGRKNYIYEAISFCYDSPLIDDNRLLAKFERFSQSYLKGIVTFVDALNQIDKIYNSMNGSGKRTNIVILYEASKSN